MIRLLFRAFRKARDRVETWYHGSFLDHLFDWLLRWPGRVAHRLQRSSESLSAWSYHSRMGAAVRVLLLPFSLLGRLGQITATWLERLAGQETPALVPDAVAKQQQRWSQKFKAWYVRKDVGTWLRASPAILALVGWLALGGVVWWQNRDRLEARYTKWADDAQKMGNYPRARVASERLLQLGGANQPAHILRLAKSLAAMGFMDESLALAAKVASDQRGFNPARLFIAEAIIDNPAANSNALRSAEKHLLQAHATEPDSAEVQALLGRYYYRAGDWEEAKWYLKRAFAQRPEVALTLSAIELRLGNELATIRWADAAARHFRTVVEKDPQDWRARLQWAEAVLYQGKATNALDILAEGMQRGASKVLSRMAAGIYTDLLKRSLYADPANLAEHLDLTIKGLGHEARNDFLMSHLVRLSYVDGPVGEKAHAALRDLARVRENRPLINFYQGMGAFMRGDFSRARVFFDAAYAQDQDNAVIANNYAWILAVSEPADPERSLKLINEIIQKYPQAPVFRETRGQVYARMGRWQDAATDLENALPFFKSNAVFRASLANVYAKLGKDGLSAEHQRAAEALRAAVERRPQ